MGFNSLESEGAARGRELLKPIIPEATIIYPTWLVETVVATP